MIHIEEVKLLAVRGGSYTVYVFQNLKTDGYIMCTKLPNWQVPEITLGDTGFLEYQIVKAGESYYNLALEVSEIYKYSNVYFINFILRNEVLHNNEIIL
ncbi:MAG: hypothetical protein ACOH2V_00820 [Candidatus Saccharimonadaceae bacterium]